MAAAEGERVFGELFPILSSNDLGRLWRFYRAVFDAEETYRFPVDGADDAVAYVALRVGSSSLGIGGVGDGPGAEAGRGRIALWVYADDCDAVVARARDAGAGIVAEPADQPWGERLAVIADPDGNEVYIGQANPQADGP
ncbi:MAG TPA: VOC family protein [Actinophytocola sp.]|nr:VOC family protein [Actinophytocola sp.]